MNLRPNTIRSPDKTKRTIILGRTGTGKSQFAMHLMSTTADFDVRPWVIIDYKGGDDIIRALVKRNKKFIKEISPYDDPPTKPGIYYMRPTPKVDDDAMEVWLFKVWNRARNTKSDKGTGILVDEGYQLPQRDGFDIILTQGRALGIPVICLYQRPTWMSRFAVAQADFFAVFEQNDERDLKTTQSFIKSVKVNGVEITAKTELPDYYCLWYDVGLGKTDVLSPAPSKEVILATFEKRLGTVASQRKGGIV